MTNRPAPRKNPLASLDAPSCAPAGARFGTSVMNADARYEYLSNAFRTPDPNGYGLTDYMPTIYSDIDLDNGVYEPLSRMEGTFRLGGMPTGKIIDGSLAAIFGAGWLIAINRRPQAAKS